MCCYIDTVYSSVGKVFYVHCAVTSVYQNIVVKRKFITRHSILDFVFLGIVEPEVPVTSEQCFSALFELQISLRKMLSLSFPNLEKHFENFFLSFYSVATTFFQRRFPNVMPNGDTT